MTRGEAVQELHTGSQMKVALIVLSGDASMAEKLLNQRYPRAVFEYIARTEIENGTVASRLAALRKRRANVLAFVTERLAWQRRQDLFMLLGALAGATEVIILDRHGANRMESRTNILVRAPARMLSEAGSGARALSLARSQLRRLETEISNERPEGWLTPRVPHAKNSLDHPRIVYLRSTPGPGTQAGGAASHIKGVTEALTELGAEVRIISNDAIAGLDESKLTILAPEPLGGTRAAFEIHNNSVFTRGAVPLILEDPPEFIYQRYARFGWSGVVASLKTNRPLFLEYNGSEVWVGRHWDHVGRLDLLKRYERLNLTCAARIFVVSEVERRNLQRDGVPLEKIVVNPNGVDVNIFRPGAGGQRVRKQLGISPEETLVGFVGSFGPWHGVLTLVDAIKLISPASRIHFLLVGTGSLHTQAKQSLMVEEVTGRAIFTGAVNHEQVPSFLDACDVLVSPHIPLADGTEFFGSPTKIFEYMAMGKGIVASRLGQIGEVLVDNESALLVDPGDVKQLSAAIVRLADSPSLREGLGRAARQKATERHTWKRNAQNVLDAYSSLIAEAG